MPRWIDQQAGKPDRVKAAQAAMLARALKRKAEAPVREAFRREQERPPEPVPRRGIQPGERRLPDLSDDELADALEHASPATPRHLRYPHLLILRERGLTRMVMADRGAGEFGATQYQGDVITEVGLKWLHDRT